MPTVSVITPVYNRKNKILRAARSVIGQTFEDLELIVVDDASTDGTAAAVASLKDDRVKLVSHDRRKGAAAGRNTGIAEARGEFVAFLDSDDEWLPEKLERQLAFMRSPDKPITASCTAFIIFTQYRPEGELRVSKEALRYEDFLLGCRVSPGSTLIAERELFAKVGPFNEKLRRLEDWEWLLRFVKNDELRVLSEALTLVHHAHSSLKYEDVVDARKIMLAEHMPATLLARRKFVSTLNNEVAAAAYKNERFALALLHITKSLWYYPYRNLDTVMRIIRALRIDFLKARK